MKKRLVQIVVLVALVISTISGISVAAAPVATAEFFDAYGDAITALTEENEISAKITIVSPLPYSCDANVIAALYEDGKMSGFSVVAKQSIVAGEPATIPVEEFSIGTADAVELFVWNGFNSLSPLVANSCEITRVVYNPSATVKTENGKTTEVVNLTVAGVSAQVPAGVAMEEGASTIGLIVTPVYGSQSGITAGENEQLDSLDVHIEGVSKDNTTPIIITIEDATAIGLNAGNLALYHVENGETVQMTRVASVDELNAHNSFYYDAATGYVTLALCTFSEIAMLSDTENAWNGELDYSWYNAEATDLKIANADQLAAFGAVVGGMELPEGISKDTFEGKTVTLVADINLGDAQADNNTNLIFHPIGYYYTDDKNADGTTGDYYSTVSSFEGTFDGNGHKISNFYQNTWEIKGDYEGNYYNDAMGLFGYVVNGTVKNLTVDNFSSDGEFTPTGVIAAYAVNSTFENIALVNCTPRVYNTGNGGIVGVGGNSDDPDTYKLTFNNITIDNTNKITALWGSYDVACGGLVGMFRGAGHVYMTNCHVGAQLDVFNDVCGNYQYYRYRYAGMLIGTNKNMETVDGKIVPETDKIHAENCTVHFGDWNNYWYCELVANSIASYTHDHQFSRLTRVDSVDAESMTVTVNGVVTAIPETGRQNYVVVTEPYSDENATCYHFVDGAVWNHADAGTEVINGEEILKEDRQHYYLPFNQVMTGYGWGVEHIPVDDDNCDIDGITILDREVADSVEKFAGKIGTSADAPYAVEVGEKLALGDMFTLAENCEVNLSGLNVTATNVNENETASIIYKGSDSVWSDGYVEFSGEGLLKLTIQDYEYCVPTDIYVFVGGNTVTFDVTPADAMVTLNGVTKKAQDGIVTFNVLDGTYDLQVAATGYVWQEGEFIASEDETYAVNLEADAEKSYWTFDNDVEGWTCRMANDSMSHSDGALVLSMTSNDPGIAKSAVNIDMTGRDRFVLTYKKENTNESDFFVYFKSVVDGTTNTISGARALIKTLPAETDGFVTAVFEKNQYFAGTLVDLRLDPITSATGLSGATFYFDKIEIPRIADLTLTPVSTVTFKVAADDAEVTLGGVTKQVTDGAVSFDIANGTYDDLQIAATGYVWQEGSLTVSEDVTYLVSLEEDSANSYWTFDNDVEGWKSAKAEDTLYHEDGALKFVMTSSDPIIESSSFELDLTGRTNIYLTYKMNMTKNDFAAYPTVSTGLYKFTPNPIPVTETYRTEILDPGSQFTQTLKKLRLDPISSAAGLSDATFWIDKIVIPRIADLSIAVASTVKFNVASDDAEVTLNGVTSGVTDGVVSFDVEKGTYDLQIAATGYVWQEGSLTVSGDAEYVVRLEKDTEKSYFTFDEDVEGWTGNGTYPNNVLSFDNGALKYEMADNDPYISSPTMNLGLTGRPKAYLTYKNNKAQSGFQFRAIQSSHYIPGVSSLPLTESYTTIAFDISSITGTLKSLRIDPVSDARNQNNATFWVDKIEIPRISSELNLVYASDVSSLAEDVSVSTVFSDHMVLQRQSPVCIWGTAEDSDGCQVEVSLGDQVVYAEVEDGKWQAYLPAMEANKTPQTLTVSGKTTYYSFEDVCVGDVYFVAGQSNSDYTFSRTDTYSADVADSANDSIRFFYQNRSHLYSNNGKADTSIATTPQENPMAKGNYKWEVAGPDTVGKISAIGYYFADTVAEAIENEIPIGLVQVASGGSTLNHSSPAEINQKYDALYETTEFTSGDASYVYNAMIHPVEKYTARGMLWYQGESDSGSNMKSLTYAERFEELVSYLEGVNGNEWDVFYVQLSSHNGATNAAVAGWKVARMRAIQYNMQAEDRIMVVSMDHGVRKADEDEAHPAYKKPVGQRLGAAALAKIYGVGTLETTQSPMPESVVYTANGATITFKNVQDGLKAYNNENVLGFELTKNGVAVPAAAEIVDNNTVKLTATGLSEPDGVRYGYYIAASLNAANLVNSADLPCPTFTLGEGSNEINPFSVGILDVENDYTGESIVLPANFAEGAHIQAHENWGITSPYSLPESPNGAVNFKNMQGAPTKPLVYLNVYADKEYSAVDLSIKYTSYDGTYYVENGTGYVYSVPAIKVNGELVNLTLTTERGKLYGLWRTDKVATVSLQPGLNRIPVEWVSGWTYIDQFILGEAIVAYEYEGGVADISSDYAKGALLNTTQNWAGESAPESQGGAVDFMNMRGTPTNPSVTLMVYADKAYENVPLSLKYSSYDGSSYADQTGFVYSEPSVKVNGELVSLTTTTGPGKGWGYWTTQQVATVNLQPGINEIPIGWVSGWIYIDRFILGAE